MTGPPVREKRPFVAEASSYIPLRGSALFRVPRTVGALLLLLTSVLLEILFTDSQKTPKSKLIC